MRTTIKLFIIIIAIVTSLGSCQKSGFLTNQSVSTFNEATIFSDSLRTIQFVNALYIDEGFTFQTSLMNGNSGLQSSCDEAMAQLDETETNLIISGQFSSTNQGNNLSTIWSKPWTDIRAANIVLQQVGNAPLSTAMKNQLRGEARFMRAWYYFILFKAYGGVPLLGDVVYDASATINVPRSSVSDVVSYISSECDAAAALLQPVNTKNSSIYANNVNFGQATSGAALGLKTRVLLYAASPLFNGGATVNNPVFGYPTYDVSRWQLAAQAGEAVIATGQYSLYVDNTTAPGYGFYKVFTLRAGGYQDASGSTPSQMGEYLFALLYSPQAKKNEGNFNPPSRGGNAANNTFPLQELAASFPDKNGIPITDPKSLYDPNNPFNNRDPRFNYTVLHQGSPLLLATSNSLQPLDVTVAPDNITTTGYYVCKMTDAGVVANGTAVDNISDPLMTYAEILLATAEATNEYAGPTSRVYQLLSMIRNRAGIPAGTNGNYGIPTGLSQADMRTFIQNEDRIELAFEEHRFWDIRRWKIAMTTENNTFTGLKPVKSPSGAITYSVVNVSKHIFRPSMYLFPIPQTELVKSPALIQNPGY